MVKRANSKIYAKEIIKTIRNNFRRYLSLICITLLGVGLFVGMNTATIDMRQTVEEYFNQTNLMDIKIESLIGITDDELQSVSSRVDGITYIEGAYKQDVVVNIKDTESVVAVNSYSPSKHLNMPLLLEGRFPINGQECVVEEAIIDAGYQIGDKLSLNNSAFINQDVTITGVVKSPLYLSYNRGSTSLLSGTINYFIYVPEENFQLDNYTLGYIKTDNHQHSFSNDYTNFSANLKDQIRQISKDISKERLSEVISDFRSQVSEREAEYNSLKSELSSRTEIAEREIETAKESLQKAQEEIKTDEEIDQYLAEMAADLSRLKEKLDNQKKQLDDAVQPQDPGSNSAAIASLNSQKNQLQRDIVTLNNQINSANNTIRYLNGELDSCRYYFIQYFYQSCVSRVNSQIDRQRQALESAQAQISSKQSQIDSIDRQINALGSYTNNAYIDLQNAYNVLFEQYNKQYVAYENAKNNLRAENEKLRLKIESQISALDQKRNELEGIKLQNEEQLAEYKLKIDEAKDNLKFYENSDWYISTRRDNAGYTQYSDDVGRISNLGRIFPVIFFIVAIFMTITSVSRMIEEERTKIGTLLALGFSKYQILMRYCLYSLSASFIGCIIGIIIGVTLLPTIFYNVYSIMYFLPSLQININIAYVVIGFMLACIPQLVVTIIACRNTLMEAPADLMIPKGVKADKRFLNHHAEFILKHLKLSHKITLRNLLRYKKRLFMTIVGVAGCSMLIVSGFALRDAISRIIKIQYEDIYSMDAQLFYRDDANRSVILSEAKRIRNLSSVEDAALSHLEVVDVRSDNKLYNAYLVSPSDEQRFYSMVQLRDPETEEVYKLSDNGAIISNKLSQVLHVGVGDTFAFTDTYGYDYEIVVEHIVEHYVEHYIYINNNYFEKIIGESPRNNMLLVDVKDGYDKNDLSKSFNANGYLTSITFLSVAQDIYADIMENLNRIVIVITVAAGLLNFIVLYNLASINISERKIELATIKVVGFRKNESNLYIKREMYILIFIGLMIGLSASYFLSKYIIEICEIDNLMFYNKFNFLNCLYSAIITIVFAILADIITNREIRRIDMTESLKRLT